MKKRGITRLGGSLALLLGMSCVAVAGVTVQGNVVSFKPDKNVQGESSSMDLSKAKPMVKRLEPGLFDPEQIKSALAGTGSSSSGYGVATRGGVGSGDTSLQKHIPMTEVESTPEISPAEYGDTVNGVNIPYTTSRVDMYGQYFSRKRPYRAAGQLFFKDGSDTYICSASLIKRGLLVTAAHCVSDYGQSRLYSDFTYIPARKNDNAPYGQWSYRAVYVPQKYFAGASDECIDGVVCKDDVAVIVLKAQDGKLAGDYTGWFGYGINTYSFVDNQKAQITQLGYPASHDDAKMMQRNDSQGIKTDSSYKYNTLIGSRMTGGSSGGPWLVNFGQRAKLSGGTTNGHEAKRNVVVGVTSWGYTSDAYKIQGASPFNKNNIKALVDQACNDYPGVCQ